jgi:hypothetical protein
MSITRRTQPPENQITRCPENAGQLNDDRIVGPDVAIWRRSMLDPRETITAMIHGGVQRWCLEMADELTPAPARRSAGNVGRGVTWTD